MIEYCVFCGSRLKHSTMEINNRMFACLECDGCDEKFRTENTGSKWRVTQ